MTNYRIAVVGHNKRGDQANTLMHQVNAVYLHVDNGTQGCDRSHRRTWTWLTTRNDQPDWLCVLEDDALPVQGFNDQLEQILTIAPCDVVGLYLGAGRPPQWQDRIQQAITKADQTNAHWILAERLLYGVGIAIRTALVPDMLTHTEGTQEPWDYAVRTWAYQNNHTIGFPLPSLLDHRDDKTLVTHPDRAPRTEPRKAWRTGTRDQWTNSTVQL